MLSLIVAGGCLGSDMASILPGAPGITTQPVPHTVFEGDTVSLSVVVTGNTPSLQWYRDGLKVDSATGTSLTFAGIRPSDAGVYFVVVSNSVGTLVSDTARLVVNPRPTVIGYTLSSGTAAATNKTYASTTADQSAVWVSGTGDLTLIDPTVTKSGDASSVSASQSTGVNAALLASGGRIAMIDGTITSTAIGAAGLYATGGATRISVTRGLVTTTGASSYAVGASQGAIVDLARTKLRAASGTLLSAITGANVTFLSEGDSLSGLVTADASSTVTVSLTKGATLTGAVQLANVSLDSASTWNVTAASAVKAFSDPLVLNGGTVTNVTGNGFKVTYDASLAQNSALGGRTYALAGGGTLAPR